MSGPEFKTAFSVSHIDRCTDMRGSPDALVKAFTEPSTRFLPLWNQRCLVQKNQVAMISMDGIRDFIDQPEDAIFLGRQDGQFLFAVSIAGDEEPRITADGEFIGLRQLSSMVAENDAGLLAYARAMVSWQRHHQYCGLCGHLNIAREGGFVMECGNCDRRCFPRLDPAIIVLVHRHERCLLGRQTSWPEGRFSTIAGFVEPGESLEDALRREVNEETNIKVGQCTYRASQPWPFPAALMIGYHAEGLSDDIRLNDAELVEARWLSREDIANGAVILPPRISVAYRLIEAWFDLGEGRSLSSLDLPAPALTIRPTNARQ